MGCWDSALVVVGMPNQMTTPSLLSEALSEQCLHGSRQTPFKVWLQPLSVSMQVAGSPFDLNSQGCLPAVLNSLAQVCVHQSAVVVSMVVPKAMALG
eukprot:5848768-Amphidinium_carterae.2